MLSATKQSTSVFCPQQSAGLTEIVVSNQTEFSFLLPSLAFLSNKIEDRWLTWVSHNLNAEKKQLEYFGFNLNRVRILQAKSEEQSYWFFWQALNEGNSHTVVGSLNYLCDKQQAILEQTAYRANCSGLLLRQRQHTHH